MVFVNSMSDLFHKDIPEAFIRRVVEVALSLPRHVFQILTKRPGRAASFFRRHADLLPDGSLPRHIWMGTSIENEKAEYRASQLQGVPAQVRFLSFEPLLGPVDPSLRGIHWVIAGGESGVGFRPVDLDWIRSLRDSCIRKRVPFFFKQVGGRTPKAGGRMLDGRTWDGFPSVRVDQAPSRTRKVAG